MPNIEQSYLIEGLPQDVWDALTNPERIQVWSGASAEFIPEPGSDYSLWNGDIRGQVLEALTNERLVQSWKPQNWQVEDSVVTFVLTPTEEGTRVDLIHENVQDWDFDATNQGWDSEYLGAVKRMIEGRSENRASASKKPAAAKKGAPRRKNPSTPKRTATGRKATAKRPKTTARKGTAKKATKKGTARKGAARKGAARKTG